MDGTEIDYFAQIRSYLLILDRIIWVDKPKHQDHRGWGWAERPRHGHNPPQPITPPAIILPLCKPRAKPQSPTFPCKLLVLSFKIQRPFSPFHWPPCPFFRSSWAVKLWELTFAFWISLKKKEKTSTSFPSPRWSYTPLCREWSIRSCVVNLCLRFS